MSGLAARAAFAGEEAGLVMGVTWVPAPVSEALVAGTDASGPAEALQTLALALGLDFAFVSATEPWAAEAVELLHEAGVVAVWSVAGVLGRVGESVGWLLALRMTAAEPGTLAVALAEALHAALDEARRGAGAGADAVLVADDLAGATGPLVSPDFALDALVPCYASVAALVGAHDVPAIFHSDGDVRTLYPALARAGFSAVHVAGPTGDAFLMSLSAAHAAGLVALGGIEAATLLEGARRQGERAGVAARGGRLLVCDDGGITLPEEVAALATALDAARAAFETVD